MDNIANYLTFNYGARMGSWRINTFYTTDHIFPVLPIKHLVNQDSEPTTPHKLETGTKLSVSNLRVLFCPCGVQKSTVNFDKKTVKMGH